MDLLEYQGKALFQGYGIPIPSKGKAVKTVEEGLQWYEEIGGLVALKGQIPLTHRLKKGAMFFVKNRREFKRELKKLFGRLVENYLIEQVLLEPKIETSEEWYLAYTLMRHEKDFRFLFSREGGIDVQKKQSVKFFISPEALVEAQGLPGPLKTKLFGIAEAVEKLSWEKRMTLVEINPLGLTKENELIALDAKLTLDDNAFPAKREKFSYIELGGDIGIIGNGAGLVMTTVDLITLFGGKPADFLDLGGGASQEVMEVALQKILERKPKGLFINIFGGITHTDDMAKGIIAFRKKHRIKIPFVTRLVGTNEEEAKRLLLREGIYVSENMEEAAKAIVSLVGPS